MDELLELVESVFSVLVDSFDPLLLVSFLLTLLSDQVVGASPSHVSTLKVPHSVAFLKNQMRVFLGPRFNALVDILVCLDHFCDG